MLFGIFISFVLVLGVIFLSVSGPSKFILVFGFVSFFFLIGFVTGMFRVIYSSFGYSKIPLLANYILLYPLWPVFFSLFCLSLSLFSVYHLGKNIFFGSTPSKILTWIALSAQLLLGIVGYFDVV